jgi:hypothetical protein
MKPLARTDAIIKQVVGDETLLYDTNDASARRLNQVSSCVWRHCTGKNTVQEIAMLLAAEVTLPAGADAEAVVLGSLEELEQHGLLVAGTAEGGVAGGFGRRDVLRTLAALPIFPSIDRIFAPTMANSASAPPDTTQTQTSSQTASATSSMAVSQSASQSASQMATPTPTATPFVTQTQTQSQTQSQTPSATLSPTVTPTASVTPSGS